MDITIKRNQVNLELLDMEIRSNLGSQFQGASFDGEQVMIYLTDDASDEQIADATHITQEHDSSQLTSSQQETANRAARLEELRVQNTPLLNLADYATAAVEIRRLAEKIAWLELELTARR